MIIIFLAFVWLVICFAGIFYLTFDPTNQEWTGRIVMTLLLWGFTGYGWLRIYPYVARKFFDIPFAPVRYKLEGSILLFWLCLFWFFLLKILLTPLYDFILHKAKLDETDLTWLAFHGGLFFLAVLFRKWEPGIVYVYAIVTRPFRNVLHQSRYGLGGSSRFQKLLANWEFAWRAGCIFWGLSLYGHKSLYLGIDDDRHPLIFGGTGGGKGTGIIVPNLLLWSQNVICLDPKNSNLHITGRNPIRGDVVVIDPCHSVNGFEDKKVKWNPLAEIDPNHPECAALIDALADGLIQTMSEKDPVWDRFTRQFFKGLTAHVLTAPEYEGRRNLVTVYHLINLPGKEFDGLVEAMLKNTAAGGMPAAGAGAISKAAGNTAGSIQATISVHFEWLADSYAQEFLKGDANSTFSVFDIAHKPMSIYINLTDTELERLSRIVRIFLFMSLYAMKKPRQARTRECLYLLDEFASLGYMSILEKSAVYVRSHGVKLMPIVHSIGQIKKLYGENWETFLNSCSYTAFLSMTGEGNKDYIMKKLGERRALVQGTSHRTRKGSTETPLETSAFETHAMLESSALELELDRDKGRYLTFPTGKEPTWVKRCD